MAKKIPYQSSLPELVRKLETNYISGTTTISKYVRFSLLDTLNKIDAYINSKHISGETDSQGRTKPFFNIVTAARNIWFRATDIDRKDIKIRATKAKDTIDAFLATIYIQDWMRRNEFGAFLNEWGRTLATYCSAVTKFVENDEGLNCMNVPWNRLIVDQVDFDNNVKIEIIELTEAQLRKRKGYNKEIVDKLCDAIKARETVDKKRKDNENFYVKLYEVHGELPLSYLTGQETDEDEYVQQMHVITFLARKEKNEFDDFTLVSGREKQDPYMITHLIPEDGRTIGIGAVEHLFQSQWMMNHTVKAIKDQLDLASKLIFQTSDDSYVGRNALSAIENGDILVHAINQPLTQVANTSHDVTALQNFGSQWKQLSNELNGISESMLGQTAPSGTAWRQVSTLLEESHSLFELMIENKGLAIEKMMRKYILPYIKNKDMNNSKEISATLNDYGITKIDSMYIKNRAITQVNKKIINSFIQGEPVSPDQQNQMITQAQGNVQDSLSSLGGQRFFKPSEISDKTWKEQFSNLEDELEINVTGENTPDKEDMATLNTVLQTIASNPRVLIDPNARLIFNKIISVAGSVSPLEIADAQPFMPPPTRRFTETLDYADAPEDVKRQMEEQAGLKPSTIQSPAVPSPIQPGAGVGAVPIPSSGASSVGARIN